MESVGLLAGGVAHDFNNMLGVILGVTEMALGKMAPDQPLRADLEEIRNAAERSAELTRQLLGFARRQPVAPKVLDLNETVAGLLRMLQRLVGENLLLDWHPGANLWPVWMDPSQIDQVLANLCVNARDAVAGAGKITVGTENRIVAAHDCACHADYLPGEYVVLTVSEDGCGMDEETLGRIFEPFFTTKGVGKGTGLGLATVYGIVKQNKGFIDVHSKVGQGTTFNVYLPRHACKTRCAHGRS
jgi:signal transduction histidine kinase